ncbi:hypothetical protein SAMN04487827_1436 [Prevotella sp. khp7]|uniref:hypothetical protein n=1 Tax=Prevotella sp. khp7 TaxID=1761885 RepID=UPI0008D5AE0C|nr:hypothetical protein [Prevotella sp. khp7]SEW08781.1 hypothetical protein SAMN04487827_1436 [Prevotella sp. khp7]
MKQMMKYTFAIVTMLLVSLGAKANGKVTVNGTDVIDEQGNSATYTSPQGQGTVAASIDNNRVVTLTITPADGYFVLKDDITAIKTVNGENAQTRAPGYNTPLDITGDDIAIGPTGKTYTFTMPTTDPKYDVEVTVDFHAVTDISSATITLSKTSYTYDGSEKKPSVTSVKLSGAELNSAYYTIGYSNNINAGTATVTITGNGIYKNTATKDFTINKAAAGLAYSKGSVEIFHKESWTQPTLTNPHSLAVTYSSSKKNVATVNAEGKVSIKGIGETTISAAFAGNANYKAQTVSYRLTVKENYKLRVGTTQLTTENRQDILGDGHFFYDEEHKWLIITNNPTPVVIESCMKDLTIFVNGNSKLERIWFNNRGNAENTGSLKFISFSNIPGSIEFSTSNTNGVISGFSSLTIDEESLLYLVNPEDGHYKNGSLLTKNGSVVMAATIGQYLKPLANGQTVVFPPEKVSGKDLTNVVIDDILYTLVQHTGNSEEDDDYYSSEERCIVLNTVKTTAGVSIVSQAVENGDYIPGSDRFAQEFQGGITFMVPSGEGYIELDVKTEDGYKLMVQIGTNKAEEIEEPYRNKVKINYKVSEPTYVYLFLAQKPVGTRIGKRQKTFGKVYSIKVSPLMSTGNPLASISGFPTEQAPEVETGTDDDDPTGIREIDADEPTADRWYTLDGRLLGNKPTKAGIYIHNKKKVVVK